MKISYLEHFSLVKAQDNPNATKTVIYYIALTEQLFSS